MQRRTFLRHAGLSALSLSLAGCTDFLDRYFAPDRMGDWGMNVHAYSGGTRELQLAALREMNITRLRITLGLEQDFASPYLGGYAASWLGILDNYDRSGIDAYSWPSLVRGVMRRGHRLAAIEVLNEPDLFLGVSAQTYVRDYLRPAWEIIKELDPLLPVVAAAPRGTQDGATYFLRMTDAGANQYCDFRGVHYYGVGAETYILDHGKPVMITETGVSDPARHLAWWLNDMPDIAGKLDTDQLYWYALLDVPETGYGIIRSRPAADGRPQAASDLYPHILDQA